MFLLSQKLSMLQEVLDDKGFQDLIRSAGQETPGFHFGMDTSDHTDWKGEWCDSGLPPSHSSHREGLEQANRATLQLVDFLQTWDSSVFRRSNLPTPLPTMRLAKEV